jgi:hypothetical protein
MSMDAAAAVDSVYRSDWGRIVATLIGMVGDVDLAEESAQEAFAAAVDQWRSLLSLSFRGRGSFRRLDTRPPTASGAMQRSKKNSNHMPLRNWFAPQKNLTTTPAKFATILVTNDSKRSQVA